MRSKKVGLVVAACLAVAAVFAGAAQAEGLEGEGEWNVEGSVVISGGPWALSFSLLGVPITVTAENVSCGTECTIENETREGVSHAMSSGALNFTGTSIDIEGEPSSCSIPGGNIETNKLRDEIVMHEGGAYDRFYPASGSTWSEFEMTGASCPLGGIVIALKGETYGEAQNATGVLAVDQPLVFNATEEETLGSTLHIGKNTAATLSGTAHSTLSGELEGATFGAEEAGESGGGGGEEPEEEPKEEPEEEPSEEPGGGTEGGESPGEWNLEGSVHISGGPWALSSTLLGVPITITAEEVSCASGSECTIENETRGGVSHAMSAGALEFTGTSVDVEGEAAPCSIPGNKITTNALRDEIVMHEGSPYDKFYPASGSTWSEFEMTGASCPLGGIVIALKGETYGEAQYATGVLAVDQPLVFNATEEETLGSTLHIGKNTAATLSGTAHNTLSGALEGEVFGAEE